jgi:hypothetical protein
MTDEPVQGDAQAAEVDRATAIGRAIAISRWQEAENKIYPLVMVDPSMYEAALTAIGRISARLRAECASQSDLFALDVDVFAFEAAGDDVVASGALAARVPVRMLAEAALAKTLPELPG